MGIIYGWDMSPPLFGKVDIVPTIFLVGTNIPNTDETSGARICCFLNHAECLLQCY